MCRNRLLRKMKADLMHPGSKRGALLLSVGIVVLEKTKVDLKHPCPKRGASLLIVGVVFYKRQRWI